MPSTKEEAQALERFVFRPGAMHNFIDVGEHGSAKVIHDEPDFLTKLRAARDGQALNATKYTRLIVNGRLWMTDADFEWRTNLEAVSKMHGDVLLGGLGIGFVVLPILKRSSVKSVTVIENCADVIALIQPQIKHDKLNVIEADIRAWEVPRKAFDCIYLDVWPDVPNEDDRKDITALKRKYRRGLRPDGWIGVWCESYARRR